MPPASLRPSRRDFLKLVRAALLEGSLLAVGGGVYVSSLEPGWFEVNQIRMKLRRLAPAFTGFRLAHISDIHMGGWMDAERLQNVVALLLAEQPDLVAITGDFLIGHAWDAVTESAARDLQNVLAPLARAVPTFAVLGNHDHWTNADAVRGMLAGCGIHELRNDVHTLTRDGQRLHLCGVDDIWVGRHDLDEILARLPADGAAILLAHEPDFADESAATGRFDLQLSGHSHGGQVVIPLLGPPVLPWLGEKYPSGAYLVNGMLQYTNRGVGMISPFVRFHCRPEIGIFHLEAG